LASCSTASVISAPAPDLLHPVEAAADLVAVKHGDIRPVKVAEGVVIPFSQGLSFLSSDAPISAIYVTHGQKVDEGDLLAELDKSAWEDRLAGALDEMERLDRISGHDDLLADIHIELGRLDADGAADENGRVQAEFNLQEYLTRDLIRRETNDLERARIQARVDALEAQKDNYAIYAPFGGVILSIEPLTVGDYPSGRDPYIYLADLNRLTVRALTEQTSFFSAAESLEASIGEGTWPIEIIPYTLEEQLAFYYEGITPPARFSFIVEDGSFDEGQAPPTDKRVLIMSHEPGKEDVLIIPVNAAHIETTSSDEGVTSRLDYAYVDVGGVRERRDIKCGRRSDIWIEVVEGLGEGELVYVE
jgi:multidrug efflux pump subunit AcrA (membrane-fusion protein)